MGTTQMAKKNERSEASRVIAKAILEQYKPTTVEEMQDIRKMVELLLFMITHED